MPYIKTPDPPFVRVARLLKGYDLNAARIAKLLEWDPHTAKRRLDNPELFKLGDLAELSAKAHIPMDEIRAAIIK